VPEVASAPVSDGVQLPHKTFAEVMKENHMDSNDLYEKRAVSLGGYGSLVPFHGILTYDPAAAGQSRFMPLSLDQPTPDEVLQWLEDVSTHIGVDPQQGRLFYSLHCKDYGLNGSGIEQLEEDLRNPFELGESLQGTLEDRHSRDLEMHRPCFTILAGAEYGLFYLLLRGGKDRSSDDSDYDVVYYAKCGVLVDQPVSSWPNLDEIRETDGGPSIQHATGVVTASVSTQPQPIPEVYPLDQSADRGDADIIGGRNPFTSEDLSVADEDIAAAIDRTSGLTFRVNGGTIGFENEEAYKTSGMSVYRPEEITMWGWPVAICQPTCDASR